MELPGPLPIVGNPPLGFRFGVIFFIDGVVPNPLDIFSKKSPGSAAPSTQLPSKKAARIYIHSGYRKKSSMKIWC
jgi:hypothetical protein